MTEELKGQIQVYLNDRLEELVRKKAHPFVIGTVQAALAGLNDPHSINQVLGALMCDMTSPGSTGSVRTKAGNLHEALMNEIDAETPAPIKR